MTKLNKNFLHDYHTMLMKAINLGASKKQKFKAVSLAAVTGALTLGSNLALADNYITDTANNTVDSITDNAYIDGIKNTLTNSSNSSVIGVGNTLTNVSTLISGSGNRVTNVTNVYISGSQNNVTNVKDGAPNSIVDGVGNNLTNSTASIIYGLNNDSYGSNNFIVGGQNNITSSSSNFDSDANLLIGRDNSVTTTNDAIYNTDTYTLNASMYNGVLGWIIT